MLKAELKSAPMLEGKLGGVINNSQSNEEIYNRGYAAGYEKGNTDGYNAGHTEGVKQGYGDGYAKGNSDGYSTGHEAGYSEGVEKGYNDGLAARTYEVWTITLTDGTIVEKEVALL